MRMKTVLKGSSTVVLSLLHFCICSEHPFNPTPESATATITLTSSTTGITDTAIIEMVGKEINVKVAFHLGYFIDSVYIEMYKDPSSQKGGASKFIIGGGTPDSQLILRFEEDVPRDTARFTMQFGSDGTHWFIVRTFKKQGYISFDTATAHIISIGVLENHAPQFIPDAPKRVYYFGDGDLVRFAVDASDVDSDPLYFDFIFEKNPPPRSDSATLRDNFFEWKSEKGDKGIYPILFKVTDSIVTTSMLTTLVIGDTTFNLPPSIITTPPTTAQTGILYNYLPEAVDTQPIHPTMHTEYLQIKGHMASL